MRSGPTRELGALCDQGGTSVEGRVEHQPADRVERQVELAVEQDLLEVLEVSWR